jgi:hypothetical protein
MRTIHTSIFYFFLAMVTGFSSLAQKGSQTIRGTITDLTSGKPLAGASILLLPANAAAISGADGRFEIKEIAPGRVQVAVSITGYKSATIPEVLVTAGKEVTLDISLEESIAQLNEVVVKARSRKGLVQNEFAQASARSFNPEEVQRFAGGRNDPSKLVSNYAGVAAGNDSRNDIVVRGNSPTGVLWRMEGLPIPNPNHYSTLGTTGGPVTILNTNALKTSDFFTGAFPAEFGNATAAVFDISLRSGNSNHHERTVQLNAFSGLEAMLEGPLGKKRNGASYLFGYRYSFAQIAQSIGLNVGTDAVPKYQDWVYVIDLAKMGKNQFSFYGMGGNSKIDFIGKDIDTTDFYARQDQDSYSKNYTSISGMKHTLDLNKRSYIRNNLSFSYSKNEFDTYQYPTPVPPYGERWKVAEARDKTKALRFHSFYNVKQNAQLSWRIGFQAEFTDLETTLREREGKSAVDPFETRRDYTGKFTLLQSYLQTRYKPIEKLTIIAGLNGMLLTNNENKQLTPRVSANYQVGQYSNIYLAYGNHAQMQPLPVYLMQGTGDDGKIDQSNRELTFTRANHYVLGFEKRLKSNWRIKTELYYQYLYDVPIEKDLSGYSVLNEGADFTFSNKIGLRNNGTGTNTGIELTIERFLSKGWYVLATGSFFDSKYKGSDGVERNTTFNYGQVINLLGGKEWQVGKSGKNAITFDTKLTSMGGRYQTPIDLEASQNTGYEVLDVTKYNSVRLDGYFRLDTKFGYRINSKGKKLSQTIYLDLQNVTGQQNIFLQRYNAERGTIGNVYQLGFFPDIMYKLQF